MVRLSPRLGAVVRRAVTPLLTHTYTRVPVTTDGEDTHGNGITVEGTPVPAQTCLYQASRRQRADEQGTVLIDVPTLHVLHDDPLAVGWLVTDVTDRDGTVILARAAVESFDPSAEAGASVLKVAVLQAVETGR